MPSALTLEEKKARAEAARMPQEPEGAPIIGPSGIKQARKRNVFNGTNGKLTIGKQIEGYHLHWLNDEKGRIPQAIEGGYEFVSPEEVRFNGTRANADMGERDRIKINVGTDESGQPLFAYLMKIRQEWYEEDQKELQKKVDFIDDSIRKGKGSDNKDDSFYVPREGIKLGMNR